MIVLGCLKDAVIELLLLLVFVLLFLLIDFDRFVFIYCISFSHPARVFQNKLELSWVDLITAKLLKRRNKQTYRLESQK